jgi:class 3 adenylate cyclase/tetratricopeptide (TPR) repeat protein
MTTDRPTTTTILFSDLVGSTELLDRAGDEDAQRLFKAHYQLLRDAVSQHGGAEVKSLGDGLMVAFSSAADAVRCAIAMQQMSRRPVNGEHLAIRVGLNAGDALRDEGDYFGTSVVAARRLCDRAGPGQILCSAVVEGLLAGRQAFSFRSVGILELKGLSTPVAACEVSYETEQPGLILTRTPFVGRDAEMSKLKAKLAEARTGHGGLVMLVGEPGIGKSRMIDEFTESARNDGAAVLIGACFEGEWSPPYAPFVEAIENYVKTAEPAQLRADLGYGAAPIARLVPALREVLPDIPEPAALQPDEERFRLLDAVSQMLVAISNRQPVVLVLDDLHWAERGTIAMLRHVARFVPKHQTLILGAYRDVELDRQHPLADALSQLRREVEYERIALKGLSEEQIGKLLTAITEHEVPEQFVHAISEETDGNPFFIREVLIHLADEGKIFQQDGRWTSNVSVEEMGIPEGVRQVIGRRLSRLPDSANKLLTTASGFNGPFRLDIAAAAAGIDEDAALDAIDAALESQLVRASSNTEIFEFTHALIRHALYGELSPPRQVRLHRQIAEAMERVYGDRAADHAPELAYQFHRSAGLPGTERGADYALAAADAAEAAAAWDEASGFFEMVVELLPEGDARHARALGRLSIALSLALRFEQAVATATSAADALLAREGADPAGEFIAEAAWALVRAGDTEGAWKLAEKGVQIKGERHDKAWARLRTLDLMRIDAADPSFVGIPVMTSERREIAAIDSTSLAFVSPITSRTEAAERARVADRGSGLMDRFGGAAITLFLLGDARRGRELWSELAEGAERSGRIVIAAESCAHAARSCTALGLFEDADRWLARGLPLAARVGRRSNADLQLSAARYEQAVMTGDGWERLFAETVEMALEPEAQDRWAFAVTRAAVSRGLAWLGQAEPAVAQIAELIAPLDLATASTANYGLMICTAAEALWLLDRRDHIETIERNLREKVIEPEFGYINVNGRLSLARLCALQGRYDEAIEWFAKARTVLDEQGARPLRAITDYDEALMYARRNTATASEASPQETAARALLLLDAALHQFAEIGMTGWTQKAEELRATLTP